MKQFLKISLMIVAVFLLRSGGVAAEAMPNDDNSAVSISATPSIIDMGGSAGRKIPFSVNITNHSSLVLPIHLAARPMLGMEGEVNDFLQINSSQLWIKFDNPDFLLDAGKTRAVSGLLIIPSDVGPAGYYADVVVRPLSLLGDSDIIRAQPELTIRLLARVAGKATEKISVSTQGSRFVTTNHSSNQKLVFSLKNLGNVHELISPVLHITKGGHDIFSKASDSLLILPKEIRQVSFDLPPSVGGGLYEAKLSYSYGTPVKNESSPSYQLIVMPFPAGFLLFVPVGVVLFGLWRYRFRLLRALLVLAKGDKTGN